MSQVFKIVYCFVSILVWIKPGLSQTAREETERLEVTVQVYNMAHAPAAVLEEAEKHTAKIFRSAGIEIVWHECPCSQTRTSTTLMLRIIPRLFGSMYAYFHDDNLGFAPAGKEGGILATIFYHRVEALTQGANPSRVLGYAIAHEIGHLLLGENAHSPTGLMRAYWTRADLKLAKRTLMQFTPEQAKLLRTRLYLRVKQQESLQPSIIASLP